MNTSKILFIIYTAGFFDSKYRGYNLFLRSAVVLTFSFGGGMFLYILYRKIKRKQVKKTAGQKNVCRLCGVNTENEECALCGSLNKDDYLYENEKTRKKFLRSISVFLILTMSVFSVFYLTPFRNLKYMDLINTAEKISGRSFTFRESDSGISHSFRYWSGIREKNISTDKDKILVIDYELKSETGYLYGVLTRGDEVIFVFGNNTSGEIAVENSAEISLILKISGENASGKYKFRWVEKNDLQ